MTQADKWERNASPGKATRAIIQDSTGRHHQGVRIKQEGAGTWLVLTEAYAVDLANQILDVIEYRVAQEASK
jgi:hypothetical protein